MRRIISLLLPFFLIGVVLCFLVLGIMLITYLFIFGAIISLVLVIIAKIRKSFFAPKAPTKPTKHTGRIIDSDEWNQL